MKQIVYIVAIILSMTSCMKDEWSNTGDIDRSNGIQIYVDALSHTVVETRADGNDGKINDLTVLVFDQNDNLTEAAKASIFSNGEIYVNLKHSTDPRKVVVMANVQQIIDKADAPFAEGATLVTITDKLLLDSDLIVDNEISGCNINTLPMLSKMIEEARIDYNTTLGTLDDRLTLTHRLTKVSAESRVSALQIEAISLRHAPANGGKLLTFNKSTDALPVIAERINYFGADNAGESARFLTGNQPLYLFASNNTSETENNTVEMIIKAKYDGDGVATYYRIRLDKRASSTAVDKTLFDLNPGIHYKIVFTKVTSSGYPTLQEAINNRYANIEYEIQDDSNMSEVLTNGQYMLNATNSDCRIYGDFDPNFDYCIADICTNAPNKTTIEITSEGNGFTVITTPSDIIRDGVTATKLKIKLKSQFTSGSVKVRVGNLTKVFTFAIEIDQAYVKIDDVLGARIVSGFESRTIALSKSAYDEKIKPTDLTDQLEGVETAYIHFNKITMGDKARIGEAYFMQKATIHHTKVIVYQRPYVELDKIKFATGSIVIGWTPDGDLRYKIGGGAEKGVLFFWASHIGLHNSPIPSENWLTSFPVYTPNSQTANSPVTKSTGYTYATIQSLVNEANPLRTNDPCKALSTGSALKWRTPFRDELLVLMKNVSPITGNEFGYHSNPYGTLFVNTELFSAGSGYLEGGGRGGINSHSYMWPSIPVWYKFVPVSVEAMGYDNPFFTSSYAGAVRCVVDDEPRIENNSVAYIVAKHDIVVKDWATAMGLDDSANDILMTGTAWAKMGTNYTGCNIFGLGWMVPATGEFESYIWPNRASIVAQGGDPFTNDYYGTSVQYGSVNRYNFNPLDTTSAGRWEAHATSKRTPIRVRCIKKIK